MSAIVYKATSERGRKYVSTVTSMDANIEPATTPIVTGIPNLISFLNVSPSSVVWTLKNGKSLSKNSRQMIATSRNENKVAHTGAISAEVKRNITHVAIRLKRAWKNSPSE